MNISVEISYYPLSGEYGESISEFIEKLQSRSDIGIEIGAMSSLVWGEFSDVMEAISELMEEVFEDESAVFNIKISNSCKV